MPRSEAGFYEQAVRRINWLIVALGIVGATATALLRGPRAGLAFLIGAAVSYMSFRGWQRLAFALAPDTTRRSPWFVIRIIALMVLAYAIIKFLGLNVVAAVAGLLVSAAAVILELVYELIYART